MNFSYLKRLFTNRKPSNQKTLGEALVFAFFLALATVIWYGHAMSSVRSSTVKVQVQYVGIEDDILFTDTLPSTVEIEVRDAGRRLKMYHVNPPTLTFDLSNQISGENGKVMLSADVIRNAVVSLIQGTTKLQNVTPELIQAAWYRQHSKTVPIRLRCQVTPAAQQQLVGETQPQTNSVIIYGDQRQVDTIEYIYTQFLFVEDVRDTMTLTVPLEAPNGIRLSTPEIQVQVIAEPFTEKIMTLPLATRRVPEDVTLRLFPSEVSVVLRVGVAHFAEIKEDDIKVFCNYPSRPTDKLPVQVECSNPHVTYTRCTPASVEFLIEK